MNELKRFFVMTGFVAGMGLSLCAGEAPPFATLDAPVANGWLDGRWKNEMVDGKPVVRITAKTAYARAKVTGAVPESGNVILTVRFFVKGDDGFAIGIGAWGSPTLSAFGNGKGWQTAQLVFPASRATQLLKNGYLPLIIQERGSKGALIGGVEAAVATPEAVLSAYRNYVRKSTEESFRIGRSGEGGLTYVDDYGPQDPLAPSVDDLKRGAIPFVRSYLKEIYPSDVPGKTERVWDGSLRMAADEFEPFQFAIKALKDLPECHAEVVSRLPAGLQTEIRWIESVPIRCQGGSKSTKWHLQPCRLWPPSIFPTCAVKTNDAQGFYVIFHAAADLRAQKVPVSIAVKNGSDTIGTFTVTVTILPFALPKRPDMMIMITQQDVVEDDEAVADLAEHGISGLAAFDGFRPGSFKEWDVYFARLKRYGVDRAFFWYLGNPQSGNAVLESMGRENFINALHGIDARVRDGRYPAFFSVTVDEAVRTAKGMAAVRELAGMIKGTNGLALKIQGGTLSDVCKYDPRLIDYVACNGALAGNRDWCRDNKRLLNIYSSSSTRVGPASMRFCYGFQAWRYGAFAMNGWALNWANGSAFNDLDGGMSDWQIVLPNWCGRPISTPSWESLREGVDDLRYVAVLEGLVKAGKAKGDVLVEIHEKGLKGLQIQGEKVVGDTVFSAGVKDTDTLTLARDLIIDAILKGKP